MKLGDKVRANGREAEIVGWDEAADRVSWLVIERGGARNTYHGHISSTRLELVPLEDDLYPDDTAFESEAGETVETDLSADELLPPVDAEDAGASE